MRLVALYSTWLAISQVTPTRAEAVNALAGRQNNGVTNGGLPTLGAQSASASASATATATTTTDSSDTSLGQPTSAAENSSASITSTTGRPQSVSSVSRTSIIATTAPTSTSTPAPTVGNTTSADQGQNASSQLPIKPRITPALAIGGVILLLTGLVYNLVGIKTRWAHVFLSTAYLSGLSITVLIVYVMNPPVSDAVQGAYLVGIFMTGLIFGGGALVFKEITEGLGCLLGGFCLAMWFLTLKAGGLIVSTTGKGIFITVFCVLAWALSFHHRTRAWGLIGATSFSGSTAFILGIDCFSRGGLKEFWLYIWDLNPSLFPLNTTTYPISRGTRVETIVIVLGCIIGIISQMKLWKVMRDRKKQREADAMDEERRRDVVEAALGRHLERQNDRDRSQWEKQFGDRLHAKRDTILWSDAHADKKRYSRISESEIIDGAGNQSTASLEMSQMSRQPRSMYVTRTVRHSNSTPAINVIPEDDETSTAGKAIEQQRSLQKLESAGSGSGDDSRSRSASKVLRTSSPKLLSSPPRSVEPESRITTPQPARLSGQSALTDAIVRRSSTRASASDHLAAPELFEWNKRTSLSSLLSRTSREAKSKEHVSPTHSQSQEALVDPETSRRESRASSLAATLDSDIDRDDLHVDTDAPQADLPSVVAVPTIAASRTADAPPAPPALEEQMDEDPEELVRPQTQPQSHVNGRSSIALQLPHGQLPLPEDVALRPSGSSETTTDNLGEGMTRSQTVTSETARSEILTKDVLAQVPSQLSNVILSYRTNEWAKHASAAEAPVYEEPDVLIASEDEVPAHLAAPDEVLKQATVVAPPPLPLSPRLSEVVPSPVEATVPSSSEGLKINPTTQTSLPRTHSTSVKVAIPNTSYTSVPVPSRIRVGPRGLRSASTPQLEQIRKTSTPMPVVVPEDTTVDFGPQPDDWSMDRPALAKTSSRAGVRSTPNIHRASYAGASSVILPDPHAASSRLSLVSAQGSRQARRLSAGAVYGLTAPARSETRLVSFDSHQPARRTTLDDIHQEQKRETMLAEWRISQQRSPVQVDNSMLHRQQMLLHRQQSQARQEHAKTARQQQDMALDIRMRAPDMQEAHREAMRRMQAGANKNLKP